MRPTILFSGLATTVELSEKLREGVDQVYWSPELGNARKQKYGDAHIKTIEDFLTQSDQEAVHGETLEALPFLNTEPLLARFPAAKPWLSTVLFNSLLRQNMLRLGFERMLKVSRPAVCVTHEDVTELFRTMVMLAKEYNIPTVHIPHNNCYMVSGRSPDIHRQTICDWVVGTPHMIQFYQENGFEGNTFIAGSPNLDHWANFRLSKETARQQLKLAPDKRTVTFLSSWGQTTNGNDDQLFNQKAFLKLLQSFDDSFQLVVKISPGEPQGVEEQYGKNLAEVGIKAVLVGRNYLDKVLRASDLVFSSAPSNALVEAALLGVKIGYAKMAGFQIGHGVPEVELDEIPAFLRDTALEQDHTELLKHDAYDNIGSSTNEIARWLSCLIG